MTYSVTWTMTAIRQLAELEAAGGDGAAVREMSGRIDRTLRRIPTDVGESRSGSARLWFQAPLGVYYLVDDVAMTVLVVNVGPSRRR